MELPFPSCWQKVFHSQEHSTFRKYVRLQGMWHKAVAPSEGLHLFGDVHVSSLAPYVYIIRNSIVFNFN